jgi:hypothetical protein
MTDQKSNMAQNPSTGESQNTYQNHGTAPEKEQDVDLPPPPYPQSRIEFDGYQNLGFCDLDSKF